MIRQGLNRKSVEAFIEVYKTALANPRKAKANLQLEPRLKLTNAKNSRAVARVRVLTTSARKPPLRTDKFAALWRIAAPVHPIRRSNCAESGYCELIRPRKGLTSNNEVGKTAKAQSLPQNA